MDINCQVVDVGIVTAVTAQFDITDIKIKSFNCPCAARTIKLVPLPCTH